MELSRKMKPVYFPYTYVPRWVAQTLAACFQHFIVYWPPGTKVPHEMQPWVDAQVMELRSPVQADDQTLKRVVEDFRSFASLYRDSKEIRTAAFLRPPGSVPFFDETAVSQLVCDLRKNIQSETNEKNLNPLFCAQVFLNFALEFDRQHDALSQELGIYEQRSQELVKNLRGPGEIDSATTGAAAEIEVDDAGDYMAQDRLQAWVRVFMEDPVDSGLVVTSNRSVFNHLIETQTAEKIIQSAELTAVPSAGGASISWRKGFLKQIHRLLQSGGAEPEPGLADIPRPAATGSSVALTLYLLAGLSSRDLFASVLKTASSDKLKHHSSVKSKNTLLGFIERRSVAL
jgi:hypothetical protein